MIFLPQGPRFHTFVVLGDVPWSFPGYRMVRLGIDCDERKTTKQKKDKVKKFKRISKTTGLI